MCEWADMWRRASPPGSVPPERRPKALSQSITLRQFRQAGGLALLKTPLPEDLPLWAGLQFRLLPSLLAQWPDLFAEE